MCRQTLSLFDKIRSLVSLNASALTDKALPLVHLLEFQVKLFLSDENLVEYVEVPVFVADGVCLTNSHTET